MRRRGAIGDILYHLIDQNGQPVASEIGDLICSIGLDDLREMVQWGVPVVVIASEASLYFPGPGERDKEKKTGSV